MQLCKARAQWSWVVSTESILQVPEWSIPICKEAGRHSRTPVWLHRESLSKTQCKMWGDQRWKWRSCTWPGRDGVFKAPLALKGIQDGWRITRRVSTATIAVKAKGNTNLLLNWVGNLMKDTEQAQMLNAFLALAFRGKVCHPGPWAQWQNLLNRGRQKLN